VGFAEFTGRDVRMPVSLRPCDPISSSLFTLVHNDPISEQVLVEDPNRCVISLPDWNLGKNDYRSPNQGTLSQLGAALGNAAGIPAFASMGENPELGLCLEVGLPN
jgi:hypothetical protein